jgi:hypothetical protein
VTEAPLVPPRLQAAAVIVLVLQLLWVVALVRSRRLGLRDSFFWLVSTVVALALTAFPDVLRVAARELRVEVPSNALFAAAIVYLLVNQLGATVALGGASARIRRLAQESALLRGELELLRGRVEQLAGGARASPPDPGRRGGG